MAVVHVVMGNDYPDAVYDNLEAAEAHCAAKRPENMRIHWRVYDFELQSGARAQPVPPLTEGRVRKGGHNAGESQIKTRPAPPAPVRVPRE